MRRLHWLQKRIAMSLNEHAVAETNPEFDLMAYAINEAYNPANRFARDSARNGECFFMQLQYLTMIVASAFMHASYNALMKTRGKDPYLLPGFFAVATLIAWGNVWREGGLGTVPWEALPVVFLAAAFYVMYQMFCNTAYQMGDISSLYPLTVLGPVLIPLWAHLFLAENLGGQAISGIALTFLGAASIKLKALSWSEAKKVFSWHGDYAGARWALAASVVYSVGAIFDKASVGVFAGPVYLGFILLFMTTNMLVVLAFSRNRPGIDVSSWAVVVLGGVALYLSFMFFRVALKEVYVSVATPIRQVSILFAMAFGLLILKEKIRGAAVVGALLILGGVTCLALARH